MQLKKLQEQTEKLKWPVPMAQLPVVSWDDFVAEAKHRPIMAVHGYIIDCESFEQEHPGGAHLIKRAIGTDATTAFFGGVYDHSNAAHNLLAMMRVGILEAGMEVEHLKDGFETSAINPDRKPDAAERLQQTQLNSQSSRPKAPFGQPQATMADKTTLSVPPSEHYRIVASVPPPRPAKGGIHGDLVDVCKARALDEDKNYNGEIPA